MSKRTDAYAQLQQITQQLSALTESLKAESPENATPDIGLTGTYVPAPGAGGGGTAPGPSPSPGPSPNPGGKYCPNCGTFVRM